MSETPPPPPLGTIGWADLTVPDAPRLRDFYTAVTGWRADPIPMGEYDDFLMVSAATGAPVAGVCHARGANAGLPPQWLVYVTVADLDASLARCAELGGAVVTPTRGTAPAARYAVVRDPAGAVVALYQPPA